MDGDLITLCDSSGKVGTFQRQIFPFSPDLAKGWIIPGTSLLVSYKQTGKLWFVSDLNGKSNIRVDAPPSGWLPEGDHARYMHDAADREDRTGWCYFIGGDRGLVKIGCSINPQIRLASLQSGSPVLLKLLAVRKGGRLREMAYHHQFASARQHGEWFKRTAALKAEISHLRPTPSEGEEG